MQSIRIRLSVVFLFLLLLVIGIGFISIVSLSAFNRAAAEIPDRWLPSAHALDDLTNYTSDFRAAEAAMLLAGDAAAAAASERDMEELDRRIAAGQLAYRQLEHDSAERALYSRFQGEWQEYRAGVTRIGALLGADARAEALRLYRTTSKSTYDAASDTLALITAHNVDSARTAHESFRSAYLRARWQIAIAMILAMLLVAGAMVRVTTSVSVPLLDLAGRMHRLAASETSIDIPGTVREDEIGEMARAMVVFRDNAIDLASSRHAFVRQAEMLEEKLAEEQRLTLLQRNFVAMASHEFRTPLTVIDGHAQRLISMRGRLGPEELAERAGRVRAAVQQLTQLIDNLIGSSRMIDGEIELYFHPAKLDLGALLREVIRVQRELTPTAQILELVDLQPVNVLGDAYLLRQLFGNLLSNAVKYSPRGDLIKVVSAREAAHAVVRIEDQGIGIPAKDLPRIFERYYRGSNTANIGGTGVGLNLVRMIADLHKGTVGVHSRAGEGSRFTVRLPLAAPLRSGQPTAPAVWEPASTAEEQRELSKPQSAA